MFRVLTLPLMVSVIIHGLIIAVVLIDLPDTSHQVKRAVPSYIKAELVTLKKSTPKPKTKPTIKTKPVKVKRAPAKTKAENSTKLAVQKQAKQLQLAKKREKQRQQEKEQLEKLRAEREQQELVRQQQEKQQREQRERELIDAIAMENAQQQAETDEELAISYTALISARITENWSRPPSARNNMEAELALSLIPTGEVVNVSVIKSSGNAAFDRSAEQAVLRAHRFPELQKLSIRAFEKYFRRFRLKFMPEDLRQ